MYFPYHCKWTALEGGHPQKVKLMNKQVHTSTLIDSDEPTIAYNTVLHGYKSTQILVEKNYGESNT